MINVTTLETIKSKFPKLSWKISKDNLTVTFYSNGCKKTDSEVSMLLENSDLDINVSTLRTLIIEDAKRKQDQAEAAAALDRGELVFIDLPLLESKLDAYTDLTVFDEEIWKDIKFVHNDTSIFYVKDSDSANTYTTFLSSASSADKSDVRSNIHHFWPISSPKPPYHPTQDELEKIDYITTLIEKANAERGGEPIIDKQRVLDENKAIITERPKTGSMTTAQSIAHKLVTYSLNANHPVGCNKATVFKSALGVTLENPEMLIELLVFDIDKATKTELITRGQKYSQNFVVDIDGERSVKINSGWILEHDGILRLTTVYVD